jgi:hypothetical protein
VPVDKWIGLGTYTWSITNAYVDNSRAYWGTASSATITTSSSNWYTWDMSVNYSTVAAPRWPAPWSQAPPEVVVRQGQLSASVTAREARTQARIVARERADELLLSMLSEPQRESYSLTGEFEVIGSAGGLYRIQRGNSGNVLWIEPGGQVGARLCAHPTMAEGWMPDQDVAVAQLLALMTDEPAFVRTANVHAGRRPPVAVTA